MGDYWSIVHEVERRVSIYDGPEEFLEQFAKVNDAAGLLFAAHWCQAEVCNGGFLQFFGNSTGVLAPEALVAFRTMGLDEWRNALTEAMAYFGDEYPRDRQARSERLPNGMGRKRREWDPFQSFDQRFFAWLKQFPDRWEQVANTFAQDIDFP